MESRIKEGDTIGNYKVGPLLGEGSYGKVYKCIELGNNMAVAIKEIQKGIEAYPPAQAEKKILEEVKGDYIIDLIETFEKNNCISIFAVTI